MYATSAVTPIADKMFARYVNWLRAAGGRRVSPAYKINDNEQEHVLYALKTHFNMKLLIDINGKGVALIRMFLFL